MINRDNQHSLKEVIDELIRVYGMTDKLLETSLIDSWEEVVGSVYAAHTEHLSVKAKTLHVKVDTPALRQELSMQRSELVKKLNKKAGKKVIEDIIFR